MQYCIGINVTRTSFSVFTVEIPIFYLVEYFNEPLLLKFTNSFAVLSIPIYTSAVNIQLLRLALD